MSGYIDDIKRNYEELHASTGESFESIANRVERTGDKNLAGWLRSRAADGAPAGTDPATTPPIERQAPDGAAETAAADGAPADGADAKPAGKTSVKAAADAGDGTAPAADAKAKG
jgi:hypothetical protein